MTRRLPLLWVVTIGGCAAMLTWATHRYHAAYNRLISERVHLQQVRAQVDQLRALPSAVAAVDDQPGATLAARIADAMNASALPRGAIESLSPESERVTPGGNGPSISRRSATLTLAFVTLPDLGRFLDTWRQRQPAWTVTSIDLKPRRDAASTGDLPLRVVLTLERMDIRPVAQSETAP